MHVLLSKLNPKFIALGTKHFLKKILKKSSKKIYCFFLQVEFTCLKATEALQGDNLLCTTQSPGVPVLIQLTSEE